jgi:hypothetical protein
MRSHNPSDLGKRVTKHGNYSKRAKAERAEYGELLRARQQRWQFVVIKRGPRVKVNGWVRLRDASATNSNTAKLLLWPNKRQQSQ